METISNNYIVTETIQKVIIVVAILTAIYYFISEGFLWAVDEFEHYFVETVKVDNTEGFCASCNGQHRHHHYYRRYWNAYYNPYYWRDYGSYWLNPWGYLPCVNSANGKTYCW
jgi:hypothetical protein